MLSSILRSKRPVVLFLALSTLMQPAFAQNTLDLVQDGVNNSYKPPVLKGPTSIPQTMHFFDNHNGSIDQGIYFRKPEPALSVTSVLATNLLPIFLST